jgi:hypothetical protein
MFLYASNGLYIKGSNAVTVLDTVAKIVCEWNVKYKHKYRPSNVGKNCQSFVDTLCLALGISFGNSLFLQSFRDSSMFPISITFTSELQKCLAMKTSVKYFMSHEKLDKFVSSLLESYQNFKEQYYFEWHILRMIDLIFWIRYKKYAETTDTSFWYEEDPSR